MLITLICLCLVRECHAGDISTNPSVTIAGEKLFLANVEGQTNVGALNEYIRTNETLENWKVLFAVRYIAGAQGTDQIVARWKSGLPQTGSPGFSFKEDDGSSPSDRRFSLSIRPPGDAYLELDSMRFVPAPKGKGVIYYQAAIRVDPLSSDSDKMTNFAKMARLSSALKTVTVQPVFELPKNQK